MNVPRTPRPHARGFQQFVAVLLVGFATNEVSDAVDLSAPWIVVTLVAALAVALLVERSGEDGADAVRRDVTNGELVLFCVVAMLIGAAASLLAVSVVELRAITLPYVLITSHELAAGAVVAVLAALGARRRYSIWLTGAFVVAGVSGMTLVLVAMRPVHEPTRTFAGWRVAIGLVAGLVFAWPSTVRVLRSFWGSSKTERSGHRTEESTGQ